MQPAEHIPPPVHIRWLIELVGTEAALRLVEVHGGTRIFVPKKITSRSEIAVSTGIEARVLAPLARARGGDMLKVPLCREWRVRLYRVRDGESYAKIARRLGIMEGTVWRILNDSGMTSQMELPGLGDGGNTPHARPARPKQ